MSVLDSIIANHGQARIVGQQHDLGKINWVNGLTDPGEMIGCGMYQQLRRHANEADATYQERILVLLETLPAEHRMKITTAIKNAAMRRAGLDTSNGRVNVMVAGQLPWHGLGVNVAEATTSAQAIGLAGLDWRVEKVQLVYKTINGDYREMSKTFATVRQDTQEALGSVGAVYKPIQNAEGFEFLDGVLEQFGARYESAGSLYGGSKVWMLAHLPRQAFTINGGDEVEPFVIFTNCHDGSEAAFAYPTTVRVVCANTFRTTKRDRSKGISIRHTGSVRDKITAAQDTLGLAVESFEEFKTASEAMYAARMPNVQQYFADVLDQVLDITQEQVNLGSDVLARAVAKSQASIDSAVRSFDRKIEFRKAVLDDIVERYESERCGVGSIRGTVWSAFNAITEHADHGNVAKPGTWKVTEEVRASRKFESVIAGPADEMKQVAYELAMSAASIA